MGHGTAGIDTVQLIGNRTRRSVTATDIGRSGAKDRRIRTLCAAGTEFHHGTSLRGAADAVCLRCDQALVVNAQKDIGFQELGLNGCSAYSQDRLFGKNGSPLRNSPDIAGKAEVCQIIQKFLGEQIASPQVVNILLGKMQRFHIFDNLFQACGDCKSAAIGTLPEKNIEIADPVLVPLCQISVTHCELVKITKH